jgi:hypothetical protein
MKEYIEVWSDENEKWTRYTRKEIGEYFRFTKKMHWHLIDKMYYHDAGYNKWIDVIYHIGISKCYNQCNHSGVFVPIGG